MHFAPLSLLAILATVVAAQDNPFKISSGFSITAGKPTTIEWTPTTQGPVTLSLRSGASSDLEGGSVIASSIPNSGKYTFTVPADTTRNSDYTLQIAPVGDNSKANYTPQFVVESSNTVKSISSSANSASSTASSASSRASGSSSNTATSSNSRSTSSSRSSATSASSAAATTEAASAPTGAASKNLLNMQGGLVAVLLGAAAAL